MIYIDLSIYTPTQNWLDISISLTAQLLSIPNKTGRDKFIDDNSNLWSDIKASLPYSEKCWISEAKEVSPRTIEHFRPKKMVSRTNFRKLGLPLMKEAQRKDWTKTNKYRGVGYWWLAFDFKNFRICISNINSVKGNRFPLKLDSPIAYTNIENHNSEEIILLDPTKQGDPDLITFEPDGKVKPTETDVTKDEFIRADISIKIYGLNEIEPLVSHRNTKWRDCFELIKDNQYFYPKIKPFLEDGELMSDDLIEPLERFDSKCKKLKEYISHDAEYSAVAKTCLLSYVKTYTWINDYVIN